MSWIIICAILILLSGSLTISTDGETRRRPKPKISRTNTKKKPSACPGKDQPMPANTYQCEFGYIDYLCGNCVPGRLTNHPRLEYPWVARVAGIKGLARVKFVVDEKGRVVWARVLDEVHPILERAAIKEVCSRTYEPFVCNGRTVKAVNRLTYSFGMP